MSLHLEQLGQRLGGIDVVIHDQDAACRRAAAVRILLTTGSRGCRPRILTARVPSRTSRERSGVPCAGSPGVELIPAFPDPQKDSSGGRRKLAFPPSPFPSGEKPLVRRRVRANTTRGSPDCGVKTICSVRFSDGNRSVFDYLEAGLRGSTGRWHLHHDRVNSLPANQGSVPSTGHHAGEVTRQAHPNSKHGSGTDDEWRGWIR